MKEAEAISKLDAKIQLFADTEKKNGNLFEVFYQADDEGGEEEEL